MNESPEESSRLAYLDALGVDVWRERQPADTSTEEVAAELADHSAAGEQGSAAPVEVAGDDWTALREEVASCTRCALHESRTQTVFGVGASNADWMVIGEAPGAEEDRRGEPFVGRAGKLLDEMLRALELDRETVFIANTLKCRPPNNRDPAPEEAAQCRGYLDRQILKVKPRVILAVGRIAAQLLLATDTPVGRLRGSVHRVSEAAIPTIVTYHPAYLLRSPSQKAKSWEDLRLARATLRASAP